MPRSEGSSRSSQAGAGAVLRKARLAFEVIAHLGSGLNCQTKGLRELLAVIIDGSVGRLVILHKDRLLRSGAALVCAMCEAKNVEVVILNQGDGTSFKEDLAKDVLEIMEVFPIWLYGTRRHKSQKLLDGFKRTVEQPGSC